MTRILNLALAGLVAFFSAPAQRPTFKSATALVEVDVIVLDQHGNFVPQLKAEDLTLLEDGKPQKIEQFYMVTHDLDTADRPLMTDGATQDQYGAHRLFVLLFDEGHLAPESLQRVTRGAEAFVQEQVSDGDIAGVFVNNAMYHGRLSTNKTELVAGIRTARPGVDTRQSLLAPFREFPRIPSEIDAVRVADGAREVTNALGVAACSEDPVQCAAAGGESQVENQIQLKARTYVRQARMYADLTLRNLQTVIRGLNRLRGRKTVIFISEGFFVEESRSQLGMIAAEAARGGTTIYSIDGRGLINHLSPNSDAVVRDAARSTAFDTGEDGPNILTAGTGGFMVQNLDDMSRAFGLIVRDTSTYYVVGYQPQNAKMDGKFRKIDVKSSRPGLRIRARKGYAAVDLPPQEAIWGASK